MLTIQTSRIQQLNDAFRTTFTGGQVMLSAGVNALQESDKAAILESVRTFNSFTPDNDPYGEHDFGVIHHNGVKVFWKIDYYDEHLKYGSENPSDPTQTCRVMTIMLAEEY
jgi:hypothetical protein